MAQKIRVVRLLEYIYESVDSMDRDMSRWQVPSNGSYKASPSLIIKSATLPLSVLEVEENGSTHSV